MDIHPIRNDKDHRAALVEIESLWSAPDWEHVERSPSVRGIHLAQPRQGRPAAPHQRSLHAQERGKKL